MKFLALQNPELKILADFKIWAFQNPKFKILGLQNAEFKILADFKILDDFKILAFQNPEFKFLADFKILAFPVSYTHLTLPTIYSV